MGAGDAGICIEATRAEHTGLRHGGRLLEKLAGVY
jgi:hypothetical protein